MRFFRDQAQDFLKPHFDLSGTFVWHESTVSLDLGAKSFFDANPDVNHEMTVANHVLVEIVSTPWAKPVQIWA
jgi:hypothetical protein